MLTRCPHCQTAFRVTSEQLKVRQGRVRCGACQKVFDALDSLADELPAMPLAEPAELMTSQEIPQKPWPELAEQSEPEATKQEEPPVAPIPVVELEPETEPETEPVPQPEPEPEPEPTPETAPGAEPSLEIAPEPQPEDEAAEAEPAAWMPEEAPPARRWPWITGTVLMLLLVAGQLLFIFRVELGVLVPELRPAFVGACETVGCSLPFPSKSELVGIESSDLAPAGTDRLLLTATIKNRAPFIQEYPHLELTLTDTRDEPMLRKVLSPAEYLPADHSVQQGFPARGEVGVKLQLDAQGVPAVGYRLYLFYP